MLKFSEDHEWVKLDGDIAEVGISPHAVEQLGDIVFIELPDTGTNVSKGDAVAVFESVKAASDIYSPAGGEIIDVNSALADDLAAITMTSAAAHTSGRDTHRGSAHSTASVPATTPHGRRSSHPRWTRRRLSAAEEMWTQDLFDRGHLHRSMHAAKLSAAKSFVRKTLVKNQPTKSSTGTAVQSIARRDTSM